MDGRVSKRRIGIGMGIILMILTILWIGAIGSFSKGRKEQITQIEQYEEYLGVNGKYKENYVGYNDIFPDSLENVSQVRDFIYFYYNPWDANYFGYLVCKYSEEELEKEISRLSLLERTAYKGIYGIEEFPYELCAVYANEVYGVIYALADEEEKEIIYVSLEFCNYFTDIDYENMMEKKYLPVGFNAKAGNDTRKAFERD